MNSSRSKATGRRHPRESGFTLLELLIAMTLLALLVAMLFGGMRLGTRAWEANDQRIEDSARLEIVQGFMRRLISQAYPLDRTERRPRRRIVFEGMPDAVTFPALLPPHLGFGGFQLVDFRLDDGANGKRLVMSWRRFTGEADEVPPDEPEGETVLFDRIAGVEFAYFGAPARGQPPRWHERWDDVTRLPSLVRVRVEFGDGDARRWPELVIAPMITAATMAAP